MQQPLLFLADCGSKEQTLLELGCPKESMPKVKAERAQLTKVLPRMLPKIEAMVADGASDEQLALNFMFGGNQLVQRQVVVLVVNVFLLLFCTVRQ